MAVKKKRKANPLTKVRSVALALPEAHEVEAWGAPTFRVKNKIFAMYASENTHYGRERPGIWIKSTFPNQDLLIRDDPDRFFKPPYVGPSGWVGMFVDRRPNWSMLAELLEDAWKLTAPKKLLAKFTKE